ncbi:hypothetical protein M8312_10675 [Sphingomonas sp. KRR8]|uniref:hypothetical protein n=1 Tax=Sphingomonas sp. KRR8 TaxID=2942996 RepID=UPI00202116BE|nr:hypothetical protein [Sphingomonas sp. KRR8]URD60245.1 hypothetical protein M8312_10675 [Sphingomonas sp. KRR8]
MAMWRDGLSRLRTAWANVGSRRDRIPSDVLEQLPLADIQKVTFYKRDELTTDLICCDVDARGQTWFFHEEAEGWEEFLRYLERLPTFRKDWYEAVVHPPFAASELVAFERR